jgi:hypothetical protein
VDEAWGRFKDWVKYNSPTEPVGTKEAFISNLEQGMYEGHPPPPPGSRGYQVMLYGNRGPRVWRGWRLVGPDVAAEGAGSSGGGAESAGRADRDVSPPHASPAPKRQRTGPAAVVVITPNESMGV